MAQNEIPRMPPIEQLKGRTIGRILIKMGLLTRDQVHKALLEQKKQKGKKKIGEILQQQDMVTDRQLEIARAAQLGMQYVNLSDFDITSEIIEKVPAQMANTYKMIPLAYDKDANELTVALDSPDNFRDTDNLTVLTGYKINAKYADKDTLEAMLNKFYGQDDENETFSQLIGEIQKDSFLATFEGRDQSIDLDDIKELSESNNVIRLLNLVLLQAIRDKASDVHFEPFENEYKMRYRIDGVLYEMTPPPRHIATALSSRIKVMANLDIAERRLPQDGRISLTVHGNPVDLRVSILPTMFGESVVLRVLDRSQVSLDVNKLGFSSYDLKTFHKLIKKPNGIIIVTGPTGSGKTTTLYSALTILNDIETKIITTEDPIEYDIEGIHQVQMKTDIGLTFARCLRSILRQDPDIVMVGEVRDLETAQISAQASLTGHLVFTTLHTNDAPSSVARLLDLGVEPFLITATIEGIVAQRLVRKICENCRRPYDPTEEQLMELELTPEDVEGKQFYYGKGCSRCNNTGYRGRLGLFEIMVFTDEIRELIMNQASTGVLRQAAQKGGMKLLRENGMDAIFKGITTVDEVIKETISEGE